MPATTEATRVRAPSHDVSSTARPTPSPTMLVVPMCAGAPTPCGLALNPAPASLRRPVVCLKPTIARVG
jgi:hypothetical protein